MAMPADPDARLFWRVAHQRYADARQIHERLDRYTAATYLGGYAVECIMKTLIISRTPPAERSAVVAGFRGSIAHNFDHLRDRLRQRNVIFPTTLIEPLALARAWSTNLRYDPRQGNKEESAAFLRATLRILNWCDNQL